MQKEKRYKVVCDRQGGQFGTGRFYTVEQWREQAIEWATQDDWEDEEIDYIQCLKQDRVLEYIDETWGIEFAECGQLVYIVWQWFNDEFGCYKTIYGIYNSEELAKKNICGYDYSKDSKYYREIEIKEIETE